MDAVCTSALVAAVQEAPFSHQCRLSRPGTALPYLHCCCCHLFAAVSILSSAFKCIHFPDLLNEKSCNYVQQEISYSFNCVRWQWCVEVTGHMHGQKTIIKHCKYCMSCPRLCGGEEVILSSVCICWGIWGGRCKNHYPASASAGCFLSTHNHLLNRSSQGSLVFYLAYFGWLRAGGGHLLKHNKLMGDIFSDSQSIQKKGQLN